MSEPIENQSSKGYWSKYSETKLISIERQILQVVKTAYRGWYVPIEHRIGSGNREKIWTISLNTHSPNTPLVLLHGFGAGVAFWCLNLDDLARHRPVYAIDLLGFGRSSRPDFSNDHMKAEEELVDSIEEWRKEVKLNDFILLGHSMGGYLATSYCIKYPEKVKHLILADPWGFAEKSNDYNPPLWLKTLKVIFYPLKLFNPLSSVRVAGPLGPWIIRKVRSDISEKFAHKLDNNEIICDYIYQCNAQKPSGESAFYVMMKDLGWAKNPMIHRVNQLRLDIPITLIYGAYSWMDKTVGSKIQEIRNNSYVKCKIIDNAGHHVHADCPECFNEMVVEACNSVGKQVNDNEGNAENKNYEDLCDQSNTFL